MKSILKITLLTLLSYTTLLSAQDTKKWYADDIYFDQSEKEVYYIDISQDNEVYMDDDSLELYDEGRMSYSMRINRFHRDYYGSSISFNYGYFHTPYDYNYGMGYMNNYAPFYNNYYGFGCTYYGWNQPPYGYNPWYSTWNYNYYSWHNPYGYGYGYTPYYYGNGAYTSSETTYYGPRNGASTNTPYTTNTRAIRNNDLQGVQNTIMRNPIIRSIVKGARESISRQPNTSPIKYRAKYNTPNKSSSSSEKQTSYQKSTRNNNTKSYSKPSNTRSNTNYTPARNSGSSRPSTSPSRRPR